MKHFRPLIQHMICGFILFEVIYDSHKFPIDYVFRAVNPAFESLFGLKSDQVLGKRISQIFGPNQSSWMDLYSSVLLTGEPATGTLYSYLLERFLDLSVYRPRDGFVTVTLVDASHRLVAEAGLRRRLNVERTIAEVSRILAFDDEVDLVHVSAILGNAVGAGRAEIVTLRRDDREIDEIYRWNAPATTCSLDKTKNLDAIITEWLVGQLESGSAVEIPDVSAMPAESALAKLSYDQQGIKASLIVPIRHQGNLIGFVGFSDVTNPRLWSEEDRYLLYTASDAIAGYLRRREMLFILRKSEERFRAVFQNVDVGVVVVGFDGLLAETNSTLQAMLGYSRQELRGMHFRSITHSDDLETDSILFQELSDGKRSHYQIDKRYIRKDGGIVWGRLTVSMFDDPDRGGSAVVGLVEDITERKAAEDALRESEKRHHLLFDHMMDGIAYCRMIFDEQDRPVNFVYLGVNTAFERLTGLTDVVGKQVTEVFPGVGKMIPELFNTCGRVALTGKSERFEFEFKPLARILLISLYSAEEGCFALVFEDITDRKRVEHELTVARDEAEWRADEMEALMDAVPAIVFVAQETQVRQVIRNRAAQELLRLPSCSKVFQSAAGDEGPANFSFMKNGVEIAREELPVQLAARGQQVRDYEMGLVFDDGDVRRIYGNASTLWDKEGKPRGAVGAFIDITELRRAEEDLRIQSSAICAAIDQIIITDNKCRIKYANPAFERASGYTARKRDGVCFDIFPENSSAKRAMDEGKAWSGEVNNGSKIEDTSITPIVGDTGAIEHFVVIKRDITDKKMMERRYSTMVSNIPGIAYKLRFGKSSVLEYIHRGTTDLFGYSEKEMLNSPHSVTRLMLTKDRRLAYSSILNAGKDGTYRTSLRIRSKGGEIRHAETVGRVHRCGNGEIEAVEGIVFDVTDRVRDQEHLSQVRRMETVGKLAAGIAHDFNNLLQGILGFTRMLSENVSLDASVRRDLWEIERASLRASDLVKRIMSFSKQLPKQFRPVDIVKIVKETLRLMRNTFPKTITIEFRPPDKMALALADPSQIQEVILNLCINARDAMPDGGKLTIVVSEVMLDEEFTIKNCWARAGSFVRCDVIDDGCGIDNETKGRAFEPFFTTKSQQGGTGLGLSMCYGIIQSHNGLINIDGEPGKGMTVSVYLPVTETEATSPLPYQDRLDVRGTETILIADDEEFIRRLTVRLLESMGYSTLLAKNGRDVMEILATRASDIDLVLLDLNMPELDGISVLTDIRALYPATRVLVVTGMDTGLYALSGKEQPHALLQKPCSPEDLLKTIRDVLQK